MPIKFDARSQNYAKSRGLQQLPQEVQKKLDRDGSGVISLEEAAQAGAMAGLNSDGQIDAQERSRLERILGLTRPAPAPTPAPAPAPARPTSTRPAPAQPVPPRTGSPSTTPTSSRTTPTPTSPTASPTPRSTPAEGQPARSGVGLHLSPALLQRHDEYDRSKLQDWSRLVNDNLDRPTADKLQLANAFFNSHLTYASDLQAWNARDFWATPVESLAKGGGDCDDFAIAKYATLRKMGIPKQDLKIAVVYYQKPGEPRQAHMVLLHQPPGEKGTILDNIDKRLKSIEERTDLTAIYTFNDAGLWLSRGSDWGARLSGTSDQVGKWQEVLGRMKTEGSW